MPEITGDTASGRSISVIRKLLPRNSNLAMAPGGGDAEDRVQRHDDRGGDQRQADGGARVRIREAGRVGLPALLERHGEHRGERRDQQRAEEQRARADEERQRTSVARSVSRPGPRGELGDEDRRAARRGHQRSLRTMPPPAPRLQQVDGQQHHEGDRRASRTPSAAAPS